MKEVDMNFFMKNHNLAVLLLIFISTSVQAFFFENSRRRSSTIDEKRYLGKLKGCTGFFVQNEDRKTLLISARHCMNFKATQWCEKGGQVYDYKLEVHRKCLGLVAASTDYDIFLMELDGPQRNDEDNVRLATFIPTKETGNRVKAVGFPVDKYANSGANTSENCWILKGTFEGSRKGNRDLQAYFNCSIYAGNSGGPVLLEGTNIAVGLPSTYAGKGKYKNKATYSKISSIDLISQFTKRHYTELSDYNVILAHQKGQMKNNFKRTYLTTGLYKSFKYPDCDFYIHPTYNTNSYVHKLKVDYKCLGEKTYTCEKTESLCENNDGKSSIEIEGDHFYYIKNGNKSRFDLK